MPHQMKDAMGMACSTHEGDEKYIQHFNRKTPREETARKTWKLVGKMEL